MEIYQNHLNTSEIYARWYNEIKDKNLGAFITFTGIVRDDGVDGLSFDIHKPLLQKWFNGWIEKTSKNGVKLFFAHSIGDVLINQSSYVTAVASKQRKLALNLINEFVEDFKANAPIWKYDLKDGKRIYAKERSQALKGAGLLKG
ncbi:molybdenum cofactor biosynthesis protein MoaE [Campylobacter sp. FMV-PI01]|uniref:Molybdopterin synthase catalytic subunit n=1 Tax=Campylobacter portucalensis TaxID=2608384 RepID=A0A6L5WIK5_9BACT|nr:molybdenum cofactor biosynthesis protein MoaE [Campylobacter portucalensis]MSN95855.1 molybdenum cofactor biosynthesis protein MoaE [Campylobacter portucalensis]